MQPDLAPAPSLAPTDRSLAENRETVLRRWLRLTIERSTIEELAERPLGARLGDLELLVEAIEPPAVEPPAARASETASGAGGLRAELDGMIEDWRASGEPFGLAIFAIGETGAGETTPREVIRAWELALSDVAGDDEILHDAGRGATAVLLPGAGPTAAYLAAERLERAAWRRLGAPATPHRVGVAACPEDGETAHDLVGAAYRRLEGGPVVVSRTPAVAAERQDDLPEPHSPAWPEPAPVTALRPR